LGDTDFRCHIIQTQFIAHFESNIPNTKRESAAAKNHVHIMARALPRLSMRKTNRRKNILCFQFK